jgi:phosphatidyl-myo-inositol alpha-mannosyltransferase
MKIALVCPFNMFDRPGGVPQVITHLYEHLKKRGHEVKIITQRPSSFKGNVPEDYVLFGITRTFKTNGLGTEGNWGMPSDGNEIAAYFKQENFDVVNVHEPWIPWLAWQIVRNSHSVYVATFHANLIDTPGGKVWTSNLFTPIGRPFVEKMHLLTATSPASAAALLSMADMKRPHDRMMVENLRYLPCGVELSYFKPIKKRQPLSGAGTKTIVYIGRIEKRKGVEYLIEAFAELVQKLPEARLIIAGQGVQAQKLKQYVRDEGIPHITFAGYVSDAERLRLLQNADLACFPSTQGEGFGIVLLEAMACGTPLLAGNNLGYVNVMKGHGRVGLVDPMATKDFANRLEVFLTDEEQRKMMISWALSEVKQYDYAKIADQYEAAFKAAIEIRRTYGHKPKRSLENNGKKHRKTIRRLFVRRHA